MRTYNVHACARAIDERFTVVVIIPFSPLCHAQWPYRYRVLYSLISLAHYAIIIAILLTN